MTVIIFRAIKFRFFISSSYQYSNSTSQVIHEIDCVVERYHSLHFQLNFQMLFLKGTKRNRPLGRQGHVLSMFIWIPEPVLAFVPHVYCGMLQKLLNSVFILTPLISCLNLKKSLGALDLPLQRWSCSTLWSNWRSQMFAWARGCHGIQALSSTKKEYMRSDSWSYAFTQYTARIAHVNRQWFQCKAAFPMHWVILSA